MPRKRRLAFFFLSSVALAGGALLACGLEVTGAPVTGTPMPESSTTDQTTPPGPDGSTDAPVTETSVDAEAGGPRCTPPGIRGPSLIEIADGGCVDSTEVTNAQYADFVAATADGGDAGFLSENGGTGLPNLCKPHVTFAPKPTVVGGDDNPVTNVNWCDAFAYCAWAGKHLCSTDSNASPGEWQTACTRAGARTFPYGSTPEAGVCNTNGADMAAVKSFDKCVGGYDGVFDMVGNAEEWTSVCSLSGSCTTYGGYWGSVPDAGCDLTQNHNVKTTHPAIGFRCCL